MHYAHLFASQEFDIGALQLDPAPVVLEDWQALTCSNPKENKAMTPSEMGKHALSSTIVLISCIDRTERSLRFKAQTIRP